MKKNRKLWLLAIEKCRMDKKALVYGCTGQDGFYLLQFLLRHDYEVIGVARRSSVDNTVRLEELKEDENFTIIEGDILDPSSINSTFSEHQPTEIYNLAAQSHVATSFQQPLFTFQVNAVGVLNLLEGIRNVCPEVRFYQASTSEMFGSNYSEKYLDRTELRKFQNEDTPLSPRSPYAVAKTAAHQLEHTYRESYGLHASAGILFNHESPKRGEAFVTRKITKYVGELVHKMWYEIGHKHPVFDTFGPEEVDKLRLGNLDAQRDWGYAGDYVKAMYLMLQQDKPGDYVIATGETHSIRDFLSAAFGFIHRNWEDYVVVDPKFYRPADVEFLLGNARKAEDVLGWKPEVSFSGLVEKMVIHDIKEAMEKTEENSSFTKTF